jgi:hypothetical protein
VGIVLSHLVYEDVCQNDLFGKVEKSDERLGLALDKLEEKFGKGIIKIGK